MFFCQRIILSDYLRNFFKKRILFLSEFILLLEIDSLSSNAIPRRRIFLILQCFFNIFPTSRILVELVETKKNMKKSSSHILMCKWASKSDISFHGLVQSPPLKITRCLKTKFQEFLERMFKCTEQTNKQTNISINVWNQHTKNFCMCPFGKALQIFAAFGSRTNSFRDNKEQTFFPPASGPTRTLRIFFWAGIHFPLIFDQLVHKVETKKNDTRVLKRLDSSHGKCSYPGPE